MNDNSKPFWSDRIFPADLRDVETSVDAHAARHLARSMDIRVRSRWLLEGKTDDWMFPTDLAAFKDLAPGTNDRTVRGLTGYLDRLIMPEVLASPSKDAQDAREIYSLALGLDHSCNLAEKLLELNKRQPEAFELLLQLDTASAIKLPAMTNKANAPLLIDMLKLKQAFTLRLIALEVASRLHRPYRWDPLDCVGGTNTPRLGSIHAKFKRNLKLARHAFDLYRYGRRNSVPVSTLMRHAPPLDRVETMVPNIISDKASFPFVSLRLDFEARIWLITLRSTHGANLEQILEVEIGKLERKLRQIESDVARFVDEHGARTRAGYVDKPTPLVRLMIACRFAAECNCVALLAGEKNSNTSAKDYSTEGESWIVRHLDALRHGRNIDLDVHRNHASTASRAFTILRFMFVDDDNMIPDKLRCCQNKQGKKIHVNSQLDAEVKLRRRFSIEELWTAWEGAGRRISITDEVNNAFSDPVQESSIEQIRRRFAAAFP